jgi:hypothetical protein
MKAYGGVDVYIHIFLTSALVGREWSVSSTCRFTPGERTHGTHWIGGWMDPRAGLDGVEKKKFDGPSVVQCIPRHYTDCAIPAPLMEG